MQIRNYLALVFMLFGATSFSADAVQMFANKNECLRHFTISSGTSNVIAGEAYCKDKVVKSAVEICADKKLLDFKMKNSISSVDEPKYVLKFKAECSQAAPAATAAATSGQQTQQSAQEAERSAQVAQQQAALAEQQKQAAAAAAAKQKLASGQQQNSMAETANLVVALAPIAEKAFDAMKTAPVGKVESIPKVGSAVPTFGASGATNTAIDSNVPVAFNLDVPSDRYSYTVDIASDGTKSYSMVDYKTGIASSNINKNEIPDGATLVSEITPAEVSKMATAMPGTRDAAAAAAKPPDAPVPATEITTSTEALTSQTQGEFANVRFMDATLSAPYTLTEAAIQEFETKWKSFAALKKTCAKLAETSGFLCIEGTSPGAQAAKKFVDVAGPILAVVNSAQKACSNTASVTDFAAKALTIAKGTCVAAKLACDGGCAIANAKLKELQAMVQAMNGKVTADHGTSTGVCNKYAPVAATVAECHKENTLRNADGYAQVEKLQAILQKETPPTAGTAAFSAAKCNTNLKDIALLAFNIGGLLMAKKGADECDKKLAASGAAGGAVTPTQYCETPANTGTQFCKCKQNANQEGCPGFAGKGSLIDKDANKDSVAGIDLKTGKGLSSFAGGSRGTATGFGPNGKQEFNPSAPGTGEKLALTGADAAAAGSGGGFGGGSAGGGGSSAGGGAGEGSGGKPEDKKWSFGSFANALGGMFGGGSGGKGASAKGNGNALNSKQEAAIKRKIASDKLAGEITSASGKSNWEKVHQVYKIKDSTLITGN